MAPRQLPDHALRDTLRDPENLRDLLGSALPDVVANFDFTQVEELPREQFTGDWREREGDLIFQVGYNVTGQTVPSVVGVLVEHQTGTNRQIPLRALFLLVNYWERHWRQWEQQAAQTRRPVFTLPPVFSVVLYTADIPWGSTTNVRELLAPPEELHQYAPDWGPQFWNLSAHTADDLLAGPPWMRFMATLRAAYAEWLEFERVLARAQASLVPVGDVAFSRWSKLLRAMMEYSLFRRPASEHDDIQRIFERENPTKLEEVRAMEKTIAQTYEERGELRGRQIGRLEQAQAALRNLIAARQFPLSEALAQQITACEDLQRLDAALVRIVQVKDMSEFTL